MRVPGGDQGRLGCLPTVPIGVTGCKLAQVCHYATTDGRPVVVLRQKGCDGIGKASIARESELSTVFGQSVHVKCRQEYTNFLIIESNSLTGTANDSEAVEKHVLRSSGVFDYKTNCTFCSFADPYDGKKSEFRLNSARTLELRDTILQACEIYNNEWVNTVNHVFCLYQICQLQMLSTRSINNDKQ